MNFAEQLRKTVQDYEDSIDEGIIHMLKHQCEAEAREGKRMINTDRKLSPATVKALKEREGLSVNVSLTSCYTYQINW